MEGAEPMLRLHAGKPTMKLDTECARPLPLCSILALLAACAGCGSGTAGVLAGGDDGDDDPAPVLTAFAVDTPRVSPLTLALEATGPTGSTLTLEVLFARPGEELHPMTRLAGPGVTGNNVVLP